MEGDGNGEFGDEASDCVDREDNGCEWVEDGDECGESSIVGSFMVEKK